MNSYAKKIKKYRARKRNDRKYGNRLSVFWYKIEKSFIYFL